MNPIPSDVLDRQLALDLQELAGGASPPDRVDAILRRLTTTSSTARRVPARSRLLVAAFMLFGVGITLAVYQLSLAAYEKTRWVFLQPVLMSMAVLIAVLVGLTLWQSARMKRALAEVEARQGKSDG